MSFKINLRLLLLALALVQIGSYVGNDAVMANAKSNRERAIAEITRLGGTVEFDEAVAGKPIVKVDLHGTQVTDADLVVLKDLKELRTLDLRLTKIGDNGVASIKNLIKLQTLNLFRTHSATRDWRS